MEDPDALPDPYADASVPVPAEPFSDTTGPVWWFRADQLQQLGRFVQDQRDAADIRVENRGQGYFLVRILDAEQQVMEETMIWPIPATGD
jgi:hypothetical protein